MANSAEIQGGGTYQQGTNYSVKVRILTPQNLEMSGDDQGTTTFASMQENPSVDKAPVFKPGMSANVDIETETAVNVVAVPIQAVTTRDFNKKESNSDDNADSETVESDSLTTDVLLPEEDFRKVVFLVEDGKVRRVEVETGVADETHVQITSGIDKNQEVVIGSYRVLSRDLKDGDKVKVDNSKRMGA
jgi:HlyD family secretion protein